LKIRVRTNFIIPEKAPKQGDLEVESGATLGAALTKLSEGTDLESVIVIGSKGKAIAIDDMWEVQVNGRACYSFPGDFDIPLNQGDVVTLWLIPLGGG
jgi:hypothetical protein